MFKNFIPFQIFTKLRRKIGRSRPFFHFWYVTAVLRLYSLFLHNLKIRVRFRLAVYWKLIILHNSMYRSFKRNFVILKMYYSDIIVKKWGWLAKVRGRHVNALSPSYNGWILMFWVRPHCWYHDKMIYRYMTSLILGSIEIYNSWMAEFQPGKGGHSRLWARC